MIMRCTNVGVRFAALTFAVCHTFCAVVARQAFADEYSCGQPLTDGVRVTATD